MSNKEISTINSYTTLEGFNLADALSEEMVGMNITFDRVMIPAAGGIVFEVPGALPGETDTVKEFSGVILFHHPLFSYYKERFTGGNNPPDCGSYDGVTGVGDPGGTCERCPLNQFGSGDNGGKACKNKRRIFILREGEMIPLILTLPTGSMKEFSVYIKRLLGKGIGLAPAATIAAPACCLEKPINILLTILPLAWPSTRLILLLNESAATVWG